MGGIAGEGGTESTVHGRKKGTLYREGKEKRDNQNSFRYKVLRHRASWALFWRKGERK